MKYIKTAKESMNKLDIKIPFEWLGIGIAQEQMEYSGLLCMVSFYLCRLLYFSTKMLLKATFSLFICLLYAPGKVVLMRGISGVPVTY